MKLNQILVLILSVVALSACGGKGGGGGGSTTTPDYYGAGDNFFDDFTDVDDGYDDGSDYDDGYDDDDENAVTYEKTQGAPKDRLKLAAADGQRMLENASTALSAQFGLSQERSFEVAKLAVIWRKTPKERKTAADYDRMATQVVGHSVTDIQSAVVKKLGGQGSELNQIIEDAADLNGVTPEHMNIIMDKMFGSTWQ